MHDTILVRNLQLHAYHGVYDKERSEGRRFAVDCEVDISSVRAQYTDALPDTVDYRDIAQAIVDVMRGPSHHLIETLADRICALIFERIPQANTIRIEMRKHATGVPGDPEWVGLRIARLRPG